jgi:hypothetical protein
MTALAHKRKQRSRLWFGLHALTHHPAKALVAPAHIDGLERHVDRDTVPNHDSFSLLNAATTARSNVGLNPSSTSINPPPTATPNVLLAGRVAASLGHGRANFGLWRPLVLFFFDAGETQLYKVSGLSPVRFANAASASPDSAYSAR